MVAMGQRLVNSINARWTIGQNNMDAPMPPLAPDYAAWKQKRYGSNKRDMQKTGRTKRGNRVLRASPGRATVGNYDPEGQKRISLNSRYAPWGVSPRDREQLQQEATVQLKRNRLVKITQS